MKMKRSRVLALVLAFQMTMSVGMNVYGGQNLTSGGTGAIDAESMISRTSTSEGEVVRQGDIGEITTDIDLVLTPAQLQHYSEPKHIYFVTDIDVSDKIQDEIRTGIHNMLNQTVLHHIYFVPLKKNYSGYKTAERIVVDYQSKPDVYNTPVVFSGAFEKNFWERRHEQHYYREDQDWRQYLAYNVNHNNIQNAVEMVLDSNYREKKDIDISDKEIIVYAEDDAYLNLDSKYDKARIHWITKKGVNDTRGKLATKHTGVGDEKDLEKAFNEIVRNIMQDTSGITDKKIPISKLLYNEPLPVGVELIDDEDNGITLMLEDENEEAVFRNIRTTGNSKIGLTINNEFDFENKNIKPYIQRQKDGNYRFKCKMKYKVKYHNSGEMNFLGGWLSPIANNNGARFFIDKYVVGVKGNYPKITLDAYSKTIPSEVPFTFTTKTPEKNNEQEGEYQFKKASENGEDHILLEGNNNRVEFKVMGQDLNPESIKTQVLRGPENPGDDFRDKVAKGKWADSLLTPIEGIIEETKQNPEGLWIERYGYNHIKRYGWDDPEGVDRHNLDWKNKTILFRDPIATEKDELQGEKVEDRKGYIKGYEDQSKVSPAIAHKKAFFAASDPKKYESYEVKETRKMWGYFQLPNGHPSGEYYFAFFADDGVYAHVITPDSVDGKSKANILVDSLRPSGPYLATIPNAKPIELKAGEKYPIYIEYYNSGGLGALQMFMRPKVEGPWTFKGGRGSKIEEGGAVNLSAKVSECFSYSVVTDMEDVKEPGGVHGVMQFPNGPGIYYVAVKAATKGGAEIQTVMGPFVRQPTETIVSYPDLCSVYPIGQLNLALDIDVSDKAYLVDQLDSDVEPAKAIVIPKTEFTFKINNENLKNGINSEEIYILKDDPKVFARTTVDGKNKIEDIGEQGDYLKGLKVKRNDEEIIVTTPHKKVDLPGQNYEQAQASLEDYKKLLKTSILITANVKPHDKLRADEYEALIKGNLADPAKLTYKLKISTQYEGSDSPHDEEVAEGISVQLIDKIIH